jgi:hypothetical protein
MGGIVANDSTPERIAQARRRTADAREKIGAWFKTYKGRDLQRQYETQLETLKSQIDFLLGKIETEIDVIRLAGGSLGVYAKSRLLERRLLWVWRLFAYFQSKFDQRQDDQYKGLLAAADEIMWSCYMQPFRWARVEKYPPHPLPFLTNAYSPYAIPREEPPVELRSDVDAAFLTEMLRQMPIPVTGVQSLALEEPWWLAYLAHESGHHVQFDFDGGSLVESFEQTLYDVGGSRWAGWSKELFADVYSLLMIGPWALWALAELVWEDRAGMLSDANPRYPSPLVRLIFMKDVASQLGLDGMAALRGFSVDDILKPGPVYSRTRDLCETAEGDLKQSASVAKAVVEQRFCDFGTLAEITEFDKMDFQPAGYAYLWGEVFRGRSNLLPEKRIRSSRLVLGGGVRAWSEISAIPDDEERARHRTQLSQTLTARIIEDREEIVREAAETDKVDLGRRNNELAELLFSDRMPRPGW